MYIGTYVHTRLVHARAARGKMHVTIRSAYRNVRVAACSFRVRACVRNGRTRRRRETVALTLARQAVNLQGKFSQIKSCGKFLRRKIRILLRRDGDTGGNH